MMCTGNCQQGRECTCVPDNIKEHGEFLAREVERLQSDLLHAQQDNAQAEAALWARVETAEADRDYWKHRAEVAEAADQEHFNQLMTGCAPCLRWTV